VSVRTGLASFAVAGLLVAGCGGDDNSGAAAAEEQTTPEQAISEIAEVRKGIDEALATYKSGDAAAADEQVGTAYLEHFELVEGPLEKVDHELNEELEHAIREDLRKKISDEAPEAEVQQLADDIKADLDKAEAALR
jgi:hypothetical protein